MSLRLRMTLLYSVLLGSVLLFFGFTVYGLVSLVLIQQVDDTLTQTSDQFIATLRVLPDGSFDVSGLIGLRPSENYSIELWNTEESLILSRPAGLTEPLDKVGREAGRPVVNTVTFEGGRLRVISVPLQTERRPVGVIQVAISLNFLEVTQSTLAKVLICLSLLAIVLAAIASWVIVGRALSPLATVTQVATQITHADDLSRRIPQAGAQNDEVGALIAAFNQTLERLEQLFSAQRRLMADVSHELRTPLTVIKGNLGLMRKMGAADQESLDSIEAEVDRLTRLAGDLLVLMQAETGRLPLDKQLVELDTILLEVVKQMCMCLRSTRYRSWGIGTG
jgi:two-component system OmpR family sensor kinase